MRATSARSGGRTFRFGSGITPTTHSTEQQQHTHNNNNNNHDNDEGNLPSPYHNDSANDANPSNDSRHIKIMAVSCAARSYGVATYDTEVAELRVDDVVAREFVERMIHESEPDVLVLNERGQRPDGEALAAIAQKSASCDVVYGTASMFSITTQVLDELWVPGMPEDADVEERRRFVIALLPVAASDQLLGSLAALLSVLYAQKVLGTVQVLTGETLHMVQSVGQLDLKDLVQFDIPTMTALQIFNTEKHPSNFIGNAKEGLSLFATLDRCCTVHGKKALRHWLLNPSTDVALINARLDEVEYYASLPNEAIEAVRCALHGMKSLPSLVRQLMQRQGNGRASRAKLVALYRCMRSAEDLKAHCVQIVQWRTPPSKLAATDDLITLDLAPVRGFASAFERILASGPEGGCPEDACGDQEEGFLIASGVSESLDELKSMHGRLPAFLNAVLARELQRIPSALVRRHEDMEWSLAHVPQHGYVVRMPTRLPPDLAEVFSDYAFVGEYCQSFLYAGEATRTLDERCGDLHAKIRDIETAILSQFTFEVLQSPLWQAITRHTARLDVLVSFAVVARANRYTRPEVTEENVLAIRAGRHALNETSVAECFIPNDAAFSQDADRIHVVTGPNFSGKTVYAKQVALVAYMTHVGCFVPAAHAVVGVTDRILTRIDSIDASSLGQSAFMTDLTQVLHMLREATPRSLVILDEFGRGTESGSGFGLFFAVLGSLAARPYPSKVVACTHFSCERYLACARNDPALATLGKEGMVRFSMMECLIEDADVEACEAKVIYLYRLSEGKICDNSLGILCARLAGLSPKLCRRAYAIREARASGAAEGPDPECVAMPDAQHQILQKAARDGSDARMDEILNGVYGLAC